MLALRFAKETKEHDYFNTKFGKYILILKIAGNDQCQSKYRK